MIKGRVGQTEGAERGGGQTEECAKELCKQSNRRGGVKEEKGEKEESGLWSNMWKRRRKEGNRT